MYNFLCMVDYLNWINLVDKNNYSRYLKISQHFRTVYIKKLYVYYSFHILKIESHNVCFRNSENKRT